MWKDGSCWETSFHLFSALVEPCTSEVSHCFISSAPFVLHCCSFIIYLLQSFSKTLKLELIPYECGVCVIRDLFSMVVLYQTYLMSSLVLASLGLLVKLCWSMSFCDCRSICCCVCRSMLMPLVDERYISASPLSPSALLLSEKSKNWWWCPMGNRCHHISYQASLLQLPEFCRSLLPSDQSLLWCKNLVETSSDF